MRSHKNYCVLSFTACCNVRVWTGFHSPPRKLENNNNFFFSIWGAFLLLFLDIEGIFLYMGAIFCYTFSLWGPFLHMVGIFCPFSGLFFGLPSPLRNFCCLHALNRFIFEGWKCTVRSASS